MAQQFRIKAYGVGDLGLKSAKDHEIFSAARKIQAVVMTKDSDFLTLLQRHGSPPKILWLTCGNTSNERLREILQTSFKKASQWLTEGETLVEISDASNPRLPT
jgi:predicted nuclease of predicted toxin-antitoxin system